MFFSAKGPRKSFQRELQFEELQRREMFSGPPGELPWVLDDGTTDYVGGAVPDALQQPFADGAGSEASMGGLSGAGDSFGGSVGGSYGSDGWSFGGWVGGSQGGQSGSIGGTFGSGGSSFGGSYGGESGSIGGTFGSGGSSFGGSYGGESGSMGGTFGL